MSNGPGPNRDVLQAKLGNVMLSYRNWKTLTVLRKELGDQGDILENSLFSIISNNSLPH